MIINFNKGIDNAGKNFLKVKAEIDEDWTDISAIPIEVFLGERLGVSIPEGYIFKKDCLVIFGDQQKRFAFSSEIDLNTQSAEIIALNMQERINAIKVWVYSLPQDLTWQVEL